MSRGFFSNWIVRNLLLAAVVVFVVAFAANFIMSRYTRHGEILLVPDFTRMDLVQAQKAAKEAGLRIVVSDSINVRSIPGGCVVKQEPKAGGAVKKDRRIHLTINSKAPKLLPMPNLIGFSLRSATAELSARGLNLKNLVYTDDMATNNVLRQEYGGQSIAPGTLIPKETAITLVLGLNEDDNQTIIPDLTGMNYKAAVQRLHESSLNVDKLVFDRRSVKTYLDSLSCEVIRQFPEHSDMSVLMGTKVTLWFQQKEQ